jgi:acyl dehydratase
MSTDALSSELADGSLWGLTIGAELPALTQHVTQEFIDRYAAASLDFNPVHIDPDWCARARVFGGPEPVLHGMAQLSLLCSVVLRAWGARTEISNIDAKFTKPVWLGETITCTGIVTELHPLGEGHDYVVLAMRARDSVEDVVGVCTLSVRRVE